MLGDPAGLKAGAVVQPVVGPVVKGSKVNVRGHVVRQKVLPFIVCPPAGSCQPCSVATASSFRTWIRERERERQRGKAYKVDLANKSSSMWHSLSHSA